MLIFTVTPISNVLVNKRCFRSDNLEYFFSKVYNDDAQIDVYDVVEKKQKTMFVSELNSGKHRMLINNKKFYICRVSENA